MHTPLSLPFLLFCGLTTLPFSEGALFLYLRLLVLSSYLCCVLVLPPPSLSVRVCVCEERPTVVVVAGRGEGTSAVVLSLRSRFFFAEGVRM